MADIAMAEMIEKLCYDADKQARALVGPDFVKRLRGQIRYFNTESGFLGLGEKHPELSSQLEFHLGKGARFSAINRPDLRLTIAHLQKYEDNPFARPFRRGNLTQAQSRRFVAGQTSLLKFDPPTVKRLIAALCFGFLNDSTGSTPSFIEIRFADAEWQCLNEYHDIRALLLKSREVPTEIVSDKRQTADRPAVERVAAENVPSLPQTPSRRHQVNKKA